jgi:hypothetical protein
VQFRNEDATDSMTQTLGPESVKAFMLWIFNTRWTRNSRGGYRARRRSQKSE